jgi:hypothetical protein
LSESSTKGSDRVQRVRKPRWVRRITVLLIVCMITSICTALVFYSSQSEAVLALEIFFVSVLGFSLIAALSYDSALCWRFVDFPWICTSFAAIVVALLNIAEAARREQASLARSEINRSFSGLIYATQNVVTNDCEELPS